jgi:hypothetical protein
MLIKPLLCVLSLLLLASYSQAVASDKQVLIATETARGEWEHGIFTPGKPEFSFRLEVDQENGKADLTEITRLKNGTVMDQPVSFITALG